jgi:N6-L-threonylcarbamoyladenine synthase
VKYLLSIESTCDETAAAIITRDREVLSSVIASQEKLHQRFSGVVPEIAARAHLERMLPVIDETLKRAKITSRDLAAHRGGYRTGLAGLIACGLATAKALSWAWNVPLVTVHHVHAHIYACQLMSSEPIFPCVGFVVSGGHTNLYHCHSASRWDYLGGTIDDAVGEAFDKVAVMLGFSYPGGPEISKAAIKGDSRAIPLPRPMVDDHATLNMSFSGLKTAVRYKLVGNGKQDFSKLELSPQLIADMAASFEAAAVECLVAKADLALKKTKLKRLCVGGGVAANRVLRHDLQAMCKRRGVELHIASPDLCTDNAVMGAIAWEKVDRGDFAALDAGHQTGTPKAIESPDLQF